MSNFQIHTQEKYNYALTEIFCVIKSLSDFQ
jgi:hypothetical protein